MQRGYVRPEDEAPEPEPALPEAEGAEFASSEYDPKSQAAAAAPLTTNARTNGVGAGDAGVVSEPPEEDEGIRHLSDKLLTELTAYRTLALREAVGNEPAIAYLAALYSMCLKLFYRYGLVSCPSAIEDL